MNWNNKILNQIAERAHVAEGSESVRDVILHLFREKNVNNKKLSQLTEIPVPTLSAIRGELIKEGILETKTKFTDPGFQFVTTILGLSLNNPFLSDGQIENLKISKFPNDILSKNELKKLEQIFNNRPNPDTSIDQSRATFVTQLKRLAILIKNGDVEGRKILFLGDDDATSLLISATNLSNNITVIDIDERILNYLTENCKLLEGKKISVIYHDLRKPLPDKLRSTYDIVFTDPPYTYSGGKLFFQRASFALHEFGQKIYFSFGPKKPEIIRNLQLNFINSGFAIYQIYHTFNKYIGNLRLGQFSNLYILKMVESPLYKEKINHNILLDEKIYTSEVRKQNEEDNLFISNGENLLEKKSIGYHLITEFYEIKNSIILEPNQLYDLVLDTCINSELSIIDSYIHIYPPHGLSIIIVLSESHIGLHTWPEHNYISIDVFICDEPKKAHLFVDQLNRILNPNKVEQININRGKF